MRRKRERDHRDQRPRFLRPAVPALPEERPPHSLGEEGRFPVLPCPGAPALLHVRTVAPRLLPLGEAAPVLGPWPPDFRLSVRSSRRWAAVLTLERLPGRWPALSRRAVSPPLVLPGLPSSSRPLWRGRMRHSLPYPMRSVRWALWRASVTRRRISGRFHWSRAR